MHGPRTFFPRMFLGSCSVGPVAGVRCLSLPSAGDPRRSWCQVKVAECSVHTHFAEQSAQKPMERHLLKLEQGHSITGSGLTLESAYLHVCFPMPTLSVFFLQDEPSSGMDPCSKRHLWQTIQTELREGCAVVLTSHR